MKIVLVGETHFTEFVHDYMEPQFGTYDADTLAEFAGRACYQSFSRPNPKTADNKSYMANILSSQHDSVLEHASATFYITRVSRALTHQLIRHRHLSYSELSQRFVDVGGQDLVLPPAFHAIKDEDLKSRIANHDSNSVYLYEDIAAYLKNAGLTRKQAREAARAVLLGHWETKIVVTGNHRAWREMIKKRATLGADAEIRELAVELFNQLAVLAPATYQDGWIRVHSDGIETVEWGPLE